MTNVVTRSASDQGPSVGPGYLSEPTSISFDRDAKVAFESLSGFEEGLRDRNRSSTSISSLGVDLRALKAREAGVLAALTGQVEGRQKVIDRLLARLGREEKILIDGELDQTMDLTGEEEDSEEDDEEVEAGPSRPRKK
jgi:hypothetical protein